MRQVHTYSGVKLAEALNVDRDTALQIKTLAKQELSYNDLLSRYQAADSMYRRCYSEPSEESLIMEVIDDLLGTHGVEGWTLPDSFTDGVSYCNKGDQYIYTVVLGPDDRFYLASWEDAYKRWPSGD